MGVRAIDRCMRVGFGSNAPPAQHNVAMARAKRKRENEALNRLLSDGSLTLASLQRVLESARNSEAVSGTSYQLRRQFKDRLQHVLHKESLVDVRGNPMEWCLCHPGKLLQYTLDTCPRLMEAYANAANKHRGQWNCIITFDEFVPGDKLKLNNRRKCMSLCFSFLELGRRFLVIPCAWLFPVCVRAVLYNALEGGWSHMLRIYIEIQFLRANALATSGIPLMLHGQAFLLTAKLTHLLSDGEGLRAAISWRGANSLRPCLRHWNCTKKNSTIIEHSADLVDITCSDPGLFKKQTDADMDENIALIDAAYRRYASGGMTKTMFDAICTSRGLTHNKNGILWNPGVRAIVSLDTITIDWVHTVLCDGAFSCEVRLVLQSSDAKVNKSYGHVSAFLMDGWQFPMHRRTSMEMIHNIFTDFRYEYAENHDRIKATASELLCVYGMLRHWVLVELDGEDAMSAEVVSFNACCDVVDIMLLAKQGKVALREAARLLRSAVSRFFEAHLACYGEEHIKPKHHWLFDIAEQWLEHFFVVDAFLIEKEHLVARAIADRTDNTLIFEQTTLAGILNSQVGSLLAMGPQAELLGEAVPLPGFDAIVADNVTIDGVKYSVGDIVFHSATPGRIVACAQEGDDLFLIVDALALSVPLSVHSAIYAFDGRRVAYNARQVSLALAWRTAGAAGLTIIAC